MPRTKVLRNCALVILCLTLIACDCQGTWNSRTSDCNPTLSPLVRNAMHWNATFDKKGAPACLRVSWGEKEDDAVGIYVQLNRQGKLFAYQIENAQFNGDIRYQIPTHAQANTRSFTLFVFGSALASSNQQTHCEQVMAKTNYQCQRQEDGNCWFSMSFQPTSADSSLQASNIPKGCQIQFPLPSQNPPERRPEEPHSQEQRDSGESISSEEPPSSEEPSPEEKQAEQFSEEPIPEEPNPEPRPEQVVEKPPEIPQSSPTWLQRAGGQFSKGHDVVTDSQNNMYITGSVSGNGDFGHLTMNFKGSRGFVAKLDHTGKWIWLKQISGTANIFGYGICQDGQGNLIVTGGFANKATFDTQQIQSTGSWDIFVAKITPAGKWLWAVSAGGSKGDDGKSVAVDKQNNIYIAGRYSTKAFFGATTLIGGGGFYDGFVAKLDSTGRWLWAKSIGHTKIDEAKRITVDSKGQPIVVGTFQVLAQFGSISLQTPPTSSRGFVAQMDTNGKWLWAVEAGMSANGVTVNRKDEVLVTGNFGGSIKIGTMNFRAIGAADMFAAKLTNKGAWLWVVQAGGKLFDWGDAIKTDAQDNIGIMGRFSSTASFGTKQLISMGDTDIYIAKLSTKGQWIWVKRGGGPSTDNGMSLAFDAPGHIIGIGDFGGASDFGGKALTSKGSYDIFLWKVK